MASSTVSKRPINRILIANRGEIACRIIATCRDLDIETVAVYSEPDRFAPFAQLADQAVCLGGSSAAESYLRIDLLIAAAKATSADAIHPGYGFLSENAEFAQRCSDEGLIFIGPTAETIAAMGDKLQVKLMLTERAPEVPLIPGYNGVNQEHEHLKEQAKNVGFPVLIKASAGGGGKGLRVVHSEEELDDGISSVQTEGKNSFGSSVVLLERYFVSCRHIEVQILGDMHGNVIHLGERDCSIQRRHQKIIEEAPSPCMSAELRARMGAAAVAIARMSNYVGAGTVEFLLDHEHNFYFLEVNTRLQVEHRVTEKIHNVDLVKCQIYVARGWTLEELGFTGGSAPYVNGPRALCCPTRTPERHGHSIECRLYAEDPAANFFPCVGKLLAWEPYEMEGVMYDSGITSGSEITVNYDPMIAKIISFGATRLEAIERMIRALTASVVLGVTTNKAFLLDVLRHEAFRLGEFDTGFIGKYFPEDVRKAMATVSEAQERELAVVATLWRWTQRVSDSAAVPATVNHNWTNKNVGARAFNEMYTLAQAPHRALSVAYEPRIPPGTGGSAPLVEFELSIASKDTSVEENKDAKSAPPARVLARCLGVSGSQLIAEIDNLRRAYTVASEGDSVHIHCNQLRGSSALVVGSPFNAAKKVLKSSAALHVVSSPMPCKLLRVEVKTGDVVQQGALLVVLESMKMEMKVYADIAGEVECMVSEAGSIVEANATLMTVTAPKSKL